MATRSQAGQKVNVGDPSTMKTAELINGDVLIVTFHNGKVAVLHSKDLQIQAMDEDQIYSQFLADEE